MRLPQPFYRLPVTFDAERLRQEVAALPANAWARHPNDIAGNSSVRLISVEGGENDDVDGSMRPTPHLEASPYIRQVLTSFGVVWGRSRLMRLAPGAGVPQHADINYHWFNRIRLHIPIVTNPRVRFTCGDETVHMAAGESWLFDNWRQHRVENPSDQERIHLVADTTGSAAFWSYVLKSTSGSASSAQLQFDPAREAMPLMEQTALAPVMHPAEIDLLIMDLRAELATKSSSRESEQKLLQYHTVLNGFTRDWRQLYLLHGDTTPGWAEFLKLRDSLRLTSRTLAESIQMQGNRVAAHSVLEGRVLRPALSLPTVKRPVFIVAAPRSGSTLLFETLAKCSHIVTLGGEAHWLVESLPELQPGPAGVDSNRLDGAQVNALIADHVRTQMRAHLLDSQGLAVGGGTAWRCLEKTPKNALRVPFFNEIFPDAQFIFLWRDPRESIASIMEAWSSGGWKTYAGLDGFDGPWSLILPPGWRSLNRRPLQDIAAFQWETTNRMALDDLTQLSPERWIAVTYAELIAKPRATTERLLSFMGLRPDDAILRHLAGALPPSRYTHTPAQPDKWKMHASKIEPLMPTVEATFAKLRALR